MRQKNGRKPFDLLTKMFEMNKIEFLHYMKNEVIYILTKLCTIDYYANKNMYISYNLDILNVKRH